MNMSWVTHELKKLHAWLNKPAVKAALAEIAAILGNPVVKTMLEELLAAHSVNDPAKVLQVTEDVLSGLHAVEADPAVATAAGIDALIAKLRSEATLEALVAIEEKDGLDVVTAEAIAADFINAAVAKLEAAK